jgi:hypothetical protein
MPRSPGTRPGRVRSSKGPMARRSGSGHPSMSRPTVHRRSGRRCHGRSHQDCPASRCRRMPGPGTGAAMACPSPTTTDATRASPPTAEVCSSSNAGSSSRTSRVRWRAMSGSSDRVPAAKARGPSSSSARRALGLDPGAHLPVAPGGAATSQGGQARRDLVSRVWRGVPDPRCPSLDVLHRPWTGALRAARESSRWTSAREPAVTRRGPGKATPMGLAACLSSDMATVSSAG